MPASDGRPLQRQTIVQPTPKSPVPRSPHGEGPAEMASLRTLADLWASATPCSGLSYCGKRGSLAAGAQERTRTSTAINHWYLKPARLPIPPPGHAGTDKGCGCRLSTQV